MRPYRMTVIDRDADYFSCFDLMRALRPHLTDPAAFAAQATRQAIQGYRLLVAWQDDQAVGLAGYRIQENLLYGRFLYIDDLVCSPTARGNGLGRLMIDAVREQGRQQGCAHLVLDTGLGNALAQRFYFRQGLLTKGLHFSQALQAGSP